MYSLASCQVDGSASPYVRWRSRHPTKHGAWHNALISGLGLGLGVVVLLAWGVVALLKKSALGQQFGSADGVIQVVGRNYLAPKKAIYLVHIGHKVLALGVTDAQIGVLSEWSAGELDLNTDKTSTSFAGHMKSMVAGLGSRQSPMSEAQS